MSDGLRDFFGGGGGGYPGVTWDGSKPPAVLEGVLLPVSASTPSVSYATEHATNIQGEALYWNPKRGAKPAQITDAVDPATGKPNQPVTQAVLNLLTVYRSNEFMTDNAVERMRADEREDDGLRRYFVRGASATKTFKDALRAIKRTGPEGPEVGSLVRVTLVKREGNDYGGKTNIVETEIVPPTDATRKVVADWLASQDDGTSFFGNDGGGDEPPPF